MLEQYIEDVYKQALNDVNNMWLDFINEYKQILDDAYNEYQDAKKSGDSESIQKAKEKYQKILRYYTLENKKYKRTVKMITNRLSNANKMALDYINGDLLDAYMGGYNDMPEGKITPNTFSMVDEATVKHLIMENAIILPKKYLDIPKDQRWNAKLIQSQLLQSILLGEPISKTATRFQKVVGMNQRSAKLQAQTLTIGTRNQGRYEHALELQNKGLLVEKRWSSATDGRTRETHRHMNGETVIPVDIPFSNGLLYPAEPNFDEVSGKEIYNCRCSLVIRVIGRKDNDNE